MLELFSISLPLLYGEGHRAFERLQEEILRQSDDESIFVWNVPPQQIDFFLNDCHARTVRLDQARPSNPELPDSLLLRSFLAPTPSCFVDGSHIRKVWIRARPTFQITNQGLQLETKALCMDTFRDDYIYVVELNCVDTRRATRSDEPNDSARVCVLAMTKRMQIAASIHCRRLAGISNDDCFWSLLSQPDQQRHTHHYAELQKFYIESGRGQTSTDIAHWTTFPHLITLGSFVTVSECGRSLWLRGLDRSVYGGIVLGSPLGRSVWSRVND